MCELFVNSLLPAHRKLIPFQNRGNDWKNLKNDSSMDKSTKDKIYAYWHFENELKENFHAFLLNLQASLQNGKEINKVKGIITASNLLKGCPEKENFLLTVVVNKFGDPDKKVTILFPSLVSSYQFYVLFRSLQKPLTISGKFFKYIRIWLP